MVATLLAASLLGAAPQSIDGVKPVNDSAGKYAQAFVKQLNDDPEITKKPDPFLVGYFVMRAKTLMPLMHTKYTAAQTNLCGIILGVFEPEVGEAMKAATSRVIAGAKDFDTFTEAEIAAVNKPMAKPGSLLSPLTHLEGGARWDYFAGGSLGALSAYTVAWHLSPTSKTFLEWVEEALQACVTQADKPGRERRAELAEALLAFRGSQGKPLDAAAMARIGQLIEASLKAATPAKHRW